MADTLDLTAAKEALESLLGSIAKGSREQSRTLADIHQARAQRQSAIADRLASTLGDQHARVRALRGSGEMSRRVAVELGRALSRAEGARDVQPGSLLLSGRVLDAAGGPLAGFTVRLSDRTAALRVPGSTVTDELGEFVLAVSPQGFDRNATDLALVVEDAQERIAGMSAAPLRVQPDVWQRVELTAATPQPPDEETTGRRTGADRRRSRRTQIR